MAYTPNTWVKGDTITSAKMNHMEAGISHAEEYVDRIQGAIDELEAGSLSAVGAAAGTMPVADGGGAWEWKLNPVAEEVADLKSAFGNGTEQITGCKPFVFTSGYYRVYNNLTVVDISAPERTNETSKTMVTTLIACQPGEKYTIRAYGAASTAAAYGYLDAECKGIYRGSASSLFEETLTVPDTVTVNGNQYVPAWLIVNNNLTNNSNNYYAYKGKSIDSTAFKRIGLLTNSDDLNDAIGSGYYYWASGSKPDNTPFNVSAIMIVLNRTNSSLGQLVFPLNTTNYTPAFRYYNGSSWSDWNYLAYTSGMESLINDLQTELEADIEAVESKLEAHEASIGVSQLQFSPGYYYIDNTVGGSSITISPSENYVCAMSACVPGDEFLVNVYSGPASHMRGYAFLDSALTPITGTLAPLDAMIENAVLEAPEKAAYLIINNRLANLSDGYSAQKNLPVGIRFDRLTRKKANALIVPSYYNENDYLKNKIDDVLERNFDITGDNFIFITDYHAHKNTGNSPALINKIYEQTGISKVFFGGDIGTSTGFNSIKLNAKAFKTLRECAPYFFACVGNHEWKLEDELYPAENTYPAANYNLVYNYYMSQMETRISEMSEFGDYWVDSKAAKIRYFFLNQNISAELTDISLKWFIAELLNVPEGYGIVVVMHHAYHPKTVNDEEARSNFGSLKWYSKENGLRNLTVRRISQILNAIKSGTTVKYALRPYDNSLDRSKWITPREYTTAEKNSCGDYNPILSTFDENETDTGAYTDIVRFDGTDVHTGVYPIAIFCGHKHEDAAFDPASATSVSDMTDENTVYLMDNKWYRYDATNESWTEMGAAEGAESLSQTETVPPILVVLTTTDCYSLKHANDPTVREWGTISEQAFDIVQIDTKARKVYCTRIGAGNNREFSF